MLLFFFIYLLQPEINDQEVEWGEFLYRILTGQELCLSVTHKTNRGTFAVVYPELSQKSSCASPEKTIPLACDLGKENSPLLLQVGFAGRTLTLSPSWVSGVWRLSESPGWGVGKGGGMGPKLVGSRNWVTSIEIQHWVLLIKEHCVSNHTLVQV